MLIGKPKSKCCSYCINNNNNRNNNNDCSLTQNVVITTSRNCLSQTNAKLAIATKAMRQAIHCSGQITHTTRELTQFTQTIDANRLLPMQSCNATAAAITTTTATTMDATTASNMQTTKRMLKLKTPQQKNKNCTANSHTHNNLFVRCCYQRHCHSSCGSCNCCCCCCCCCHIYLYALAIMRAIMLLPCSLPRFVSIKLMSFVY